MTSNNNSTYQENQKNSQILDGDIPGMIEQEVGSGEYRFLTPVGDKSLSVSVANIVQGTPSCNSPMMAQTALAIQKQSAGQFFEFTECFSYVALSTIFALIINFYIIRRSDVIVSRIGQRISSHV